MQKMTLGLPQGSLQGKTMELMALAGYPLEPLAARCYRPRFAEECDFTPFLLRPQDIPTYVQSGQLDLALTGNDCLAESGCRASILAEFIYAKAGAHSSRWVLSVHESSAAQRPADLANAVIATEVPSIATQYFARQGLFPEIVYSHGASEGLVPHFADAVVDLAESGSTQRINRLRQVCTVFENTVLLIGNEDALYPHGNRAIVAPFVHKLKEALVRLA